MKWSLTLTLFLIGCSSNRVSIERKLQPLVSLPKGTTIEVQAISGSSTFRYNLNQALAEQGEFQIIHSQERDELIDGKLRGTNNRQNYPQASYLIRGHVQEEIEKRKGTDGTVQYAATSRPYLQLIKAETGEVLVSKNFVGTSLSQTYLTNSNTAYDGRTDAINSARRTAIEKFLSQFSPQITWMEIELIPFSDRVKFDEVKNLIGHNRFNIAKEVLQAYLNGNLDDQDKGKAIFALSVVESGLGNNLAARDLALKSHSIFPDERMLKFLKRIEHI